ncbi:hypothetical protein NL388_30830, partial [Klebsiella pneumoniae]|nr:hypothetical protein [Klebsiella pneumoniae]
ILPVVPGSLIRLGIVIGLDRWAVSGTRSKRIAAPLVLKPVIVFPGRGPGLGGSRRTARGGTPALDLPLRKVMRWRGATGAGGEMTLGQPL